MEIQVTEDTFEQEVLKSGQPVLVDFWAPWCKPCLTVAPVVEELAEEYAGRVKVGKVNCDECPDTAARYNVLSIPTLLFFKEGKVVEQIVGVRSKADIKKILDSLI